MAIAFLPGVPRPFVFAHRGYSAAKTENTMSAFRAAHKCGATGIELDIQMCSTGELVVFHDWTVDRMTGTSGTVAEMSWRELSKLTLPDSERIPRLTEVLDELGSDMYFDIEIKTRGRGGSGIEQALATMIQSRGLADRVLVSSFNPYPLKEFKRIASGIPTSIIFTNGSTELPWYLRRGLGRQLAGTDGLKPDQKQVTRLNMIPRKMLGVSVLPWTVDDPAEAVRLVQAGCDGVITNDPPKIMEALRT